MVVIIWDLTPRHDFFENYQKIVFPYVFYILRIISFPPLVMYEYCVQYVLYTSFWASLIHFDFNAETDPGYYLM